MDVDLSEFIDDFERRLILYGVEYVHVTVRTDDGQTYKSERSHVDE